MLAKLARLTRSKKLPWAHALSSFLLRSLMRNDEAVAEIRKAVRAAPRNAAIRAFSGRVRIIYRYVE